MAENKLQQLLPCPFCGKKPEIKYISSGTNSGEINEYFRLFRIWCPFCGCTRNHNVIVTFDYSPITGLRADETKLQKEIEEWNRRAEHATD